MAVRTAGAVRGATRLALTLTLAPAACGPATLEAPPEITSEAEPGASDLVFFLQRHDKFVTGGQVLSLAGVAHGRPVGFDLELSPWVENAPGFVNLTTFDCKATLRSQGAASDALVAFLDEHLATRSSARRMAPAVELQVVAPWGDPKTFESGTVLLALAFNSAFDDGSGAQMQLQVDAPSRRVKLRECNPVFRRAFVAALAGE